MDHDLALLEVSRLTRGTSLWERCIQHYDMLLDAGLSHERALRIAEDVSRTEQERNRKARSSVSNGQQAEKTQQKQQNPSGLRHPRSLFLTSKRR